MQLQTPVTPALPYVTCDTTDFPIDDEFVWDEVGHDETIADLNEGLDELAEFDLGPVAHAPWQDVTDPLPTQTPAQTQREFDIAICDWSAREDERLRTWLATLNIN